MSEQIEGRPVAADEVTAGRIVAIPVARLRANPRNPRPPITEQEVEELAESIAATGQHQPCLVRPVDYAWEDAAEQGKAAPDSMYEVVIGHRRVRACEVLGFDVECVVQPMGDEEALAVMVADNLQRTDPDPFAESRAVMALRSGGVDVRETAAVLGKSVGWVATRSELSKLLPEVADVLRERGWPIGSLEDYARLAPEAQKAFLEPTQYVRDREDLRRRLAEALRELGKAPWDLADAELVPAAGPCAGCPKTSLSTPGLFEGEPLGNQDLKLARCRDPKCWEDKTRACQARAALKQLEATPAAVLVDRGHGYGRDLQKEYPWAGGRKVLIGAELTELQKKDKGAVPAVFLDRGGGVRRGWVRGSTDAGSASQATKKELAKAKEQAKVAEREKESFASRLKRSEEEVGRRRMAVVVDLAREAVEGFGDVVSSEAAGALVGAYPVGELVGADGYTLQGAAARKRRMANLELYREDRELWAADVWQRAVRGVVSALKRFEAAELEGQHQEALRVLELLGIDRKPIEAKALERIPDPAWWGKGDPAAKKAAAVAAAQKEVDAGVKQIRRRQAKVPPAREHAVSQARGRQAAARAKTGGAGPGEAFPTFAAWNSTHCPGTADACQAGRHQWKGQIGKHARFNGATCREVYGVEKRKAAAVSRGAGKKANAS